MKQSTHELLVMTAIILLCVCMVWGSFIFVKYVREHRLAEIPLEEQTVLRIARRHTCPCAKPFGKLQEHLDCHLRRDI